MNFGGGGGGASPTPPRRRRDAEEWAQGSSLGQEGGQGGSEEHRLVIGVGCDEEDAGGARWNGRVWWVGWGWHALGFRSQFPVALLTQVGGWL